MKQAIPRQPQSSWTFNSRKARRKPEEIQKIWQEYWDDPSDDNRNQLVEVYMRIVEYTAKQVHNKLPCEVEVEDLVSEGCIGLMGAIKAFDRHRGVKFHTFAVPRIRGTILDYLRNLDEIPRLMRTRSRVFNEAGSKFFKQHGRLPDTEESRKTLGLSKDEFAKQLRDFKVKRIVSLQAPMPQSSYKEGATKEIRIEHMVNNMGEKTDLVAKETLDAVMHNVSGMDRTILYYYYIQAFTMREVGTLLHVSESRTSQLHADLLERIKKFIETGYWPTTRRKSIYPPKLLFRRR